MVEAKINVGSAEGVVQLFGTGDQHLKVIRDRIGAKFSVREGKILIRGNEAQVLQATKVFEQLKNMLAQNGIITPREVDHLLALEVEHLEHPQIAPFEVGQAGVSIRPRTPGQVAYVSAMRDYDLVFCTGPAGTGKTYLAVAAAVEALKSNQVRKIVLVRPAVEAGESLGFLPGDLEAKINPYLRPLLDALREMIDFDQVRRYMNDEVIEVMPLAYMRGRTLNSSFIILDESQNTTVAQMKMFLTRMGTNSKIVVTGDASQTDLGHGVTSGLNDAIRRLKNIEGFKRVALEVKDIVRHRLVQAIVNAYDPPKK